VLDWRGCQGTKASSLNSVIHSTHTEIDPSPPSHSLQKGGLWAIPVILLLSIWLWSVFTDAAALPEQWSLVALVVAVLALVAGIGKAYPRRPGRLSLLVLGLFAAYTLWTAVSASWALSETRAWVEAVRLLAYLLIFALALTYFTQPAARRAFRYVFLAALTVLCGAVIWRLWSAADAGELFQAGRLTFPLRHPNGAAALYLVPFWPLLWLASSREERAPLRGASLGLATCLLGLAVLTHSKGAAWSLAVSLIFMFAVSPRRLRLFLYLLVPTLLTVYQFPRLNRYFAGDPSLVGGMVGGRTLLAAALAGASIGMVLALLEGWIQVKARVKAVLGLLVFVACVGGLAYGAYTVQEDKGLAAWMEQVWEEWAAVPTPEASSRTIVWDTAWKQFQASPVAGVGGDNFALAFDRLRPTNTVEAEHAHSLVLEVLVDTGVIGGVLAFGGMLLAGLALIWPRILAGWTGARSTWLRRQHRTIPPEETALASEVVESAELAPPARSRTGLRIFRIPGGSRWGADSGVYGWHMAILASALFWALQADLDALWQLTGVNLSVLLLVAAGLADLDAARVEPATAEPRQTPEAAAAGPPPPTSSPEAFFSLLRRAERHRKKLERRAKNPPADQGAPKPRRARTNPLAQPPGMTTKAFRMVLIGFSVLLLSGAGTVYISQRLVSSAVAISTSQPRAALARAEAARWFALGDASPFLAQATVFHQTAVGQLQIEGPDRAGIVLDYLSLALDRATRATRAEPADWWTYYTAAWTATELLLARAYVDTAPQAQEEPPLALEGLAPSLSPYPSASPEWSVLAGTGLGLPRPGEARSPLKLNNAALVVAAHYRSHGLTELRDLALDLARQGELNNPLEPRLHRLQEFLDRINF